MTHPSASRTRWAAIGAAVAITIGAGGIGITNASIGSGERSIFVPVEPCRLVDTRTSQSVPGRKAPLAENEAHTFDVGGTNGKCGSFAGATALSLNVTPVGPTAATYLAFVPGRMVPPTNGYYDESSNLNPTPGQPPTPNAVEVALDAERFSIYNAYGSVDVIVDVVGYYADHHHDDLYYTKGQVDGALTSKADAGAVAPLPNGWNEGWFQIPLASFTPEPQDRRDAAGAYDTDHQVDDPRWKHDQLGGWVIAAAESYSDCLIAPIDGPEGAMIDDIEIWYLRTSPPNTTTTSPGSVPVDEVTVTVGSLNITEGQIPPSPGPFNYHFGAIAELPETPTNEIVSHHFENDDEGFASEGLTQAPLGYDRQSPTIQICAYRDLQIVDVRAHFSMP